MGFSRFYGRQLPLHAAFDVLELQWLELDSPSEGHEVQVAPAWQTVEQHRGMGVHRQLQPVLVLDLLGHLRIRLVVVDLNMVGEHGHQDGDDFRIPGEFQTEKEVGNQVECKNNQVNGEKYGVQTG